MNTDGRKTDRGRDVLGSAVIAYEQRTGCQELRQFFEVELSDLTLRRLLRQALIKPCAAQVGMMIETSSSAVDLGRHR